MPKLSLAIQGIDYLGQQTQDYPRMLITFDLVYQKTVPAQLWKTRISFEIDRIKTE